MQRTGLIRLITTAALGLTLLATGCANNSLGLRYPAPSKTIKLGYDSEADVVQKMGPPFRRSVDSKGRTILTYVWADGGSQSRTCIVGFNAVGIAAVLDVAR